MAEAPNIRALLHGFKKSRTRLFFSLASHVGALLCTVVHSNFIMEEEQEHLTWGVVPRPVHDLSWQSAS